jgi:branched-chain amino acid transport system permease protein
LLLGLIGALSRGYISEHWGDGIIFGILILILVFRPTGLLGERTGEKV